jgi:hypothetical protein
LAIQPAHLTIFDGYVPLTRTLPSGNLLFIAPPSSTEVFSVTGRVDQPTPRAVSSRGDVVEDPLLAYVGLGDVRVLEAVRVSTPVWARPVIVGDTDDGSYPLLWAGEWEGRRVAVLAFDLRRSDLPLQVAFPLLLANLTAWLAPTGGSQLPSMVSLGSTVSLALAPEAEPGSVRVTRPDGSLARVEVEGGQTMVADTQQLGLYEVRWGEGEVAHFAVNLFSPQESDIRPADHLQLAGTGASGAAETVPGRSARRERWRVFASLALFLLVVEWLVYHRATIARLWNGVKPAFARLTLRHR